MKRLARPLVFVVAAVLVISLFETSAQASDPPPPPTLIAPTEGATVTTNPTFNWSKPDNAVKFRIQISSVSDFSSGILAESDTPNTWYTPTTDLPQTTLYWRVLSYNAANHASAYSGSASFTKVPPDAPNVTGPPDGGSLDFPSQPVTLRWDALPNTQRYDIEIDVDNTFNAPLTLSTNTQLTEYTVTTALTFGQTYWWHVRGVSASGRPTQWSSPRAFVPTWNAVPNLTSPPDTQTPAIENVVLQWDWLAGAASYDVEVAKDVAFTNKVLTVSSKATTFAPNTNLNNSSYYWRVRGKTSAGAVGQWSATRTFQRAWPGSPFATGTDPGARVVQTAPANGQSVKVPTFKWTPFRQASYYEVQFSVGSQFETGAFASCVTRRVEFTPFGNCPVNFDPGFIYYWRVRPIDQPGNINGLFTDTDVFGNYPSFVWLPDVPVLTGPPNSTSTNAPLLRWNTVDDFGRYRVTVKRGSSTVLTQDTYNTAFVPQLTYDTEIPANNNYSWYVEPLTASGLTAAPSPTRTFTLTAPGTGSSPDPLTSTSSGQYAPAMLWSPVTGATKYTVRINWNTTVLAENLTVPGFVYPEYQMQAGDYAWYVEAFDKDGVLLATGSVGFFTITQFQSPNGGAVLTAPAHCSDVGVCASLLDTPTFTWNRWPGAGGYQVIQAADPNFTNIIRTYSTNFTRLTPLDSYAETQAGQATYWFVKPCYGTPPIHCGPGPELFPPPNNPPINAFRKASYPVTLLSPPDLSTRADQITFTWQDYLTTNTTPPCSQPDPPTLICPKQEAQTYRFQASQQADFSVLIDNVTVDQTTYTPYTATYPEGPIYWRVAAIDGSGNQLQWSIARLVNKVSPTVTLTAPSPAQSLTELPTFRWDPQDFAAKYEIEVYKNTGQPLALANRVVNAVTPNTAFTPTAILAPNATYGWRVRRLDGSDKPGPWTAADNLGLRLFTYNGTPITLVAPANNFAFFDNSVLFTWQSVAGAATYQLQTSTSNAFLTYTDNINTVMNAYAPTHTWAGGTYYWRVQSKDANGNVLSTSAVRSFSFGLPGPPVNVTAVAGNGQATVTWQAPTLLSGTPPITRYTVTSSPTGATCEWNTGDGPLTCLVSGLLNGTTYTFTVKATNSNGTGPASSPSNPVVPGTVPTAPRNPAATAGDAQATVSWTAPTNNGGTAITSYTVTSTPGNRTCTWTAGPLTCTVTGLTNGTPYTFKVKATNATGVGPESLPTASVTPTSADWYHPLPPARILDSRPTGPQVGPYGTPWGPSTMRSVQVTGTGNVPAGADAVVLNVTVTSTTAASYLSIWPKDQPQPLVSSLNWAAGQTIPNAVTVKVGNGGNVSVYNSVGSVNVIFDVVGYYDTNTGDGFTSQSPQRILDSRPTGPQVGPYGTPWGPATTRDVQVTNVGGVPPNADAVVLNVTVTNATAASFLSIWPAGQPQPVPLVSSLNWVAGQTIPNAVTVKAGAGGMVSVYNSAGSVNVIVDVVGYFTPGSGTLFHPISPQRIQDSRSSGPLLNKWSGPQTRDLPVGGVFGIPANADSVLLNVTVTGATAPSFLTIWPASGPQPNASSLNFVAGQTIPNAVTVKSGTAAKVSIYNVSGQVHVIADAGGYYL
ncbi:MAG: fibronectin type III domain-containing protein [Actinobacteria bacterium]|nr:fibronectin type III domain-containing protein [Actinomycetota bacterium]